MNTFEALASFVLNYQVPAYFLVFFGIVIEGELVLVLTGIFLYLGVMDPLFSIPVAFLGAMAKTLLGYKIGSYLSSIYPENKLMGFFERKVLFFLPSFKEKPFWSIFVSKFIYGVNHLTLVFSGYLKIDFKKYFKAEFYSSIVWVLGMILVGFMFGFAALNITKDIKKFFLIAFIFFAIFIFFQKIIKFIYEIWKNQNNKKN